MRNNWIVVASSLGAKIFETVKGEQEIHLLEHIDHPEGRLKVSDIESDRPGGTVKGLSGKPKNGPRIMRQAHDLKKSGDELFIKNVLDHLEHRRKEQQFEKMLLITEKKLGPFFAKHMPDELEKVTISRVNKNYYQMPTAEIYNRLKEDIHYSFPVL